MTFSHKKKTPITVNTVRIAPPRSAKPIKPAKTNPSNTTTKSTVAKAPKSVTVAKTPPAKQAGSVKPAAKSNAKPAETKTNVVKKETGPIEAIKPEKKPLAKAEIKPAAKPSAKSELKSENQQKAALREIEDSLAILATPVAEKKVTDIEIPTFPPSEQVLALDIVEQSSAIETLAFFLQQALRLPEFGEVKVCLSIDRQGHLLVFDIVEAKSEKNAQFLKNQLPLLQFPCLNEVVSLTITFTNE